MSLGIQHRESVSTYNEARSGVNYVEEESSHSEFAKEVRLKTLLLIVLVGLSGGYSCILTEKLLRFPLLFSRKLMELFNDTAV